MISENTLEYKKLLDHYSKIALPESIHVDPSYQVVNWWAYPSYIGGVHLDNKRQRILFSVGLKSWVVVFRYDQRFEFIIELCHPHDGSYVEPLGVSTFANGEIIIGTWGGLTYHFSVDGRTEKPALVLSRKEKENQVRRVKPLANDFFLASLHSGQLAVIKSDLRVYKFLGDPSLYSEHFGTFMTLAVSKNGSVICAGSDSGHVFVVVNLIKISWWVLRGSCNSVTFDENGELYVCDSHGYLFKFNSAELTFELIDKLSFNIAAGCNETLEGHIVFGDFDGRIILYNPKQKNQKVIAKFASIINDISIDQDQKKILIGCENGFVYLLSPQSQNTLLSRIRFDLASRKVNIISISHYFKDLENCFWLISQDSYYQIVERDLKHWDDNIIEGFFLRLLTKLRKGESKKSGEYLLERLLDGSIELNRTNSLGIDFFKAMKLEIESIQHLDINSGYENREKYLFLQPLGIQVKEKKYIDRGEWSDRKEQEELTFDKGMPDPLSEADELLFPYCAFFIWRHRVLAIEGMWDQAPIYEIHPKMLGQLTNVYDKLVIIASKLRESFFIKKAFEASERSRSRLLMEEVSYNKMDARIDRKDGLLKTSTLLPPHMSCELLLENLKPTEGIIHFHLLNRRLIKFELTAGFIDSKVYEIDGTEDPLLIPILEDILDINHFVNLHGLRTVHISLPPQMFRESILSLIKKNLNNLCNIMWSFLPSVTLWQLSTNESQEATSDSLLVVCDPLDDLRSVADIERAEISKWFTEKNVSTLERGEATMKNIHSITTQKGFGIIHFICHGSELDKDTGRNYLLLSNFGGDGGKMYPSNAANLNIPKSVVILSTCFSAQTTELVPGEIDGLVRGFLSAGARSVIASSKQIDSIKSFGFMKQLYRFWFEEKMPLGQAFQMASTKSGNLDFTLFGSVR